MSIKTFSPLAKYLKGFLFLSLFFLLMILPSVNGPGLKDATETGKFFFASHICIVLFLLIVLDITISAQTLTFTFVDVLFILIISLGFINRNFLQDHHSFSLRGFELIGLIIIYIALRRIGINLQALLFTAIVIAGIIQSAQGVFQLTGLSSSNNSEFVVTGSFLNPGPYAGYLVSTLPVIIGFFIFRRRIVIDFINNNDIPSILKKPLFKNILVIVLIVLSICGAALFILIIVPTYSRAAWISVIIINLTFLFYYVKLKIELRSVFKRIIVLTVMAIFSLAFLFHFLYGYKKASADGRVTIWKSTVQMILKKPLTGVGFDGFKSAYMRYQADYLAKKGNENEKFLADDTSYAFNEPLQFTAENGLFIALIAAVIVVLLLNANSPEHANLIWISKSALLAIFVFSLFSYPSQILAIKLNAVFYISFLVNAINPKIVLRVHHFNRISGIILKISIILIGISASLIAYKNIEKLYKAYAVWGEAYESFQAKDYIGSLEYYGKSSCVFKTDGDFSFQHGRALLSNKDYKMALYILTCAKENHDNAIIETALGDCHSLLDNFTCAEQAYLLAYKMTPVKITPLYSLVKLYGKYGKKQEETNLARFIITKKLKIRSKESDDIISEMNNIIHNRKNIN